jgi:hypothetical protein
MDMQYWHEEWTCIMESLILYCRFRSKRFSTKSNDLTCLLLGLAKGDFIFCSISVVPASQPADREKARYFLSKVAGNILYHIYPNLSKS